MLRRIGILAVPATFMLAGIGMLTLFRVDAAAGEFFERIRSQESAWIAGHVILLGSTMLMLPCAIMLRSLVRNRAPGMLASITVLLTGVTSILLAGQYAIDFVVPLMARVGGDALTVHGMLTQSPLVNILFYGLPNLAFLALMILFICVVWDGRLSRSASSILILNWLAVLLGNLIHPLFQRTAIILLGLSSIPVVLALVRKKQA